MSNFFLEGRSQLFFIKKKKKENQEVSKALLYGKMFGLKFPG